MFQSLKIVLKRPGKLIAIFLLTILLPSVSLIFFGVLALRNESFRLEKQFNEEQKIIAEQFRFQVGSNIINAENELQLISRNPLLINHTYRGINPLLDNQLAKNRLIGQFFIVYNDSVPWFLNFPSEMESLAYESTLGLQPAQTEMLKIAENYEFIQKNYSLAISAYKELLINVYDKNIQAQILNHIGRNLVKNKKYQEAVETYFKIIDEFPTSKSPNGIPLAITARIQLVNCYLKSGDNKNALNEALDAFDEILLNFSIINENQFNTYTSIVIESFTTILEETPDSVSFKEGYIKEYENLKNIYQSKIEQWQIVNDLKNECIPEILREMFQSNTYSQNTLRYSKTYGENSYLILSSMIPDKNNTGAQGILGFTINCNYFESDFLKKITDELMLNKNDKLVVTNLKGGVIFGDKKLSDEISGTISFFDDNFPPWRIEITSSHIEGLLFNGIFKSFYFWTIITIIIILIFGVLLVVKTIGHEMDVLKLKSEFISSVSHEFKTPITSIKALTERLLDQKVKDPARLKEYYSVILGDADNLSRLVSNFLDFAKIEDGKKQYDFEETDILNWMPQTINNLRNKYPQNGIKFKTHIVAEIPLISIDQNAMELAINNLLDNAIKFSSGMIVVEIFVETDENNLYLKIRDNGIGIQKEDINKIFEKFYRGRNAPEHTSTGTGLGLTLVKQIIEAHCGMVSVESKVGGGSVFTLTIPFIRKP